MGVFMSLKSDLYCIFFQWYPQHLLFYTIGDYHSEKINPTVIRKPTGCQSLKHSFFKGCVMIYMLHNIFM